MRRYALDLGSRRRRSPRLRRPSLPTGTRRQQGFLGRWNLTGTGEDTNRDLLARGHRQGRPALSGMFLNRGGSPVPLASVAVENNELVFQLAAGNNKQPGAEFRARLEGGKLVGTTKAGDRDDQFRRRPSAEVAEERRQREAHLRQAGRALRRQDDDGFDTQPSNYPVTLGGRGRRPRPTRRRPATWCRSRSSRTSASRRNTSCPRRATAASTCAAATSCRCSTTTASRPKSTGTWRSTAGRRRSSTPASRSANGRRSTAIVVGNRVTVTLNGQKVHDNAEIQAITGGALDANETEPGPILIQGDHTKVASQDDGDADLVNRSGSGFGTGARRVRLRIAQKGAPGSRTPNAPGPGMSHRIGHASAGAPVSCSSPRYLPAHGIPVVRRVLYRLALVPRGRLPSRSSSSRSRRGRRSARCSCWRASYHPLAQPAVSLRRSGAASSRSSTPEGPRTISVDTGRLRPVV